jgi:CheY-like chemotaxis protein
MRVLVIDDEAQFLRTLQRILQRGHEVQTAESASLAFSKVEGGGFDVILCDLHMPEMDGPAFVAKLSAIDAAKVIYTTGGAVEPGDQEFIDTHRVLAKPFTCAQLTDAMEAVVRRAA